MSTRRAACLRVVRGFSPFRPAPRRHLMVGGREDIHRGNTRGAPEASDPFACYGVADVFVSSDSEEAFPLVLPGAAIFDLHSVTTDANGVPAMLSSDHA